MIPAGAHLITRVEHVLLNVLIPVKRERWCGSCLSLRKTEVGMREAGGYGGKDEGGKGDGRRGLGVKGGRS